MPGISLDARCQLYLGADWPTLAGSAPVAAQICATPWCWRRRQESGAEGTHADIALADDIPDRYVDRMLRLACLAPEVLGLTCGRRPLAVSLYDLCFLAEATWHGQVACALD